MSGQMSHCSGSGLHDNRCFFSFEFGGSSFPLCVIMVLKTPLCCSSPSCAPNLVAVGGCPSVPALAKEVVVVAVISVVEPGFVCMSESRIQSWLYPSLHL